MYGGDLPVLWLYMVWVVECGSGCCICSGGIGMGVYMVAGIPGVLGVCADWSLGR